MHPFRFGIQVSELPFDGWRERVRWYEELGFTTISTPDHYMMRQWDPVSLVAAVAGATRSAAVGRRREATGLSYFVVFDLANNYVNPGTWAPSLPGDGGPGAADRYLEAFAESVVRPLTGQ